MHTNADQYPLDRNTPPVDVIPAPLSADSYRSSDLFSMEMETIWRREWVFIGPRSSLPPKRGYVSLRVGTSSIIITVENGTLRAFRNACAHRGCELVDGSGESNTMSCPYHAWVYGMDGHLRSARDFAGAGSNNVPPAGPAKTSLVEVAVSQWLDFVFVNLSSDTPSLQDSLEPITSRWSHVDLTNLQLTDTLEYEFSANWKLIIENFLESYHVPFLHRDLDQYSPATGRYQVQLPNNINGIGTKPYEGVSIDGVSMPNWRHGEGIFNYAEYFHSGANFLIGIMPDHLFAWEVSPIAPDRTIESLYFYFPDTSATYPQYDQHRQETLRRWSVVNDEDHDIVQKMHRGLTTGPFERAQLSPVMERNIFRFQNWIKGAYNDR